VASAHVRKLTPRRAESRTRSRHRQGSSGCLGRLSLLAIRRQAQPYALTACVGFSTFREIEVCPGYHAVLDDDDLISIVCGDDHNCCVTHRALPTLDKGKKKLEVAKCTLAMVLRARRLPGWSVFRQIRLFFLATETNGEPPGYIQERGGASPRKLVPQKPPRPPTKPLPRLRPASAGLFIPGSVALASPSRPGMLASPCSSKRASPSNVLRMSQASQITLIFCPR
jgi:hypothetical protein